MKVFLLSFSLVLLAALLLLSELLLGLPTYTRMRNASAYATVESMVEDGRIAEGKQFPHSYETKTSYTEFVYVSVPPSEIRLFGEWIYRDGDEFIHVLIDPDGVAFAAFKRDYSDSFYEDTRWYFCNEETYAEYARAVSEEIKAGELSGATERSR